MDVCPAAIDLVGNRRHTNEMRRGAAVRNPDGSPIWIRTKIRLNRNKHWEFSQPDWDEFYVIRGNGPLTRVALRRMSYEQGEWVRRAALGQPFGLPPGRN